MWHIMEFVEYRFRKLTGKFGLILFPDTSHTISVFDYSISIVLTFNAISPSFIYSCNYSSFSWWTCHSSKFITSCRRHMLDVPVRSPASKLLVPTLGCKSVENWLIYSKYFVCLGVYESDFLLNPKIEGLWSVKMVNFKSYWFIDSE